MKIWFDLSNSPHINLFATLIHDLQKHHEVVITCRPLANTIDLLDLHGFEYKIVGIHYGNKISSKLFGYPIRIWQLYKYLKPLKIDVAVSQSSFHSPVVAKMLGIRSIYMNDNEHALGNVPSFLCATHVLVPEFLSLSKVIRQGALPGKIIKYPGIKEGIYLADFMSKIRSVLPGGRPQVYIRPEPWTAQYYKGAVNFLEPLIVDLSERCAVVILPRGNAQAERYKSLQSDHVKVLEGALNLGDIVPNCDLFIGAGGTMTREMAVVGVPTISIYQSELLDVDKHLIAEQAMIHEPALTVGRAMEYLAGCGRRTANQQLLDKGRKAYAGIKNLIVTGNWITDHD